MISRPYKTRSYHKIEDCLKKARNRLQMRDWEIELTVGRFVPSGFEKFEANSGASIIDINNLKTTIWINTKACKENNEDPLNVAYHEIAHAFDEYHKLKEVRANIIALLLEGL